MTKPKTQKTWRCSVFAHTDGRLTVKTPYNAEFVQALKDSIPYQEREYDRTHRVWYVEPSHFNTIAHLIQVWYGETIEGDLNLKLADPFTILHIAPTCPLWLAQQVYRLLVKHHHPDAGGDADEMALINRAWEQVKTILMEAENDLPF